MLLNKKISVILVFVGCLFLLYIIAYLFLLDLDFFINGKTVSGRVNIVQVVNNRLLVKINYYDDYKNNDVEMEKKFNLSYRDELNRLDSNSAAVIYTKWFEQVYVKDVKKPRGLSLLVDIIMLLIAILFIWSAIWKLKSRDKG